MQITIDTHKFVKFLSEKKHFTQEQAEILIEAATEYHNAYTKELATKNDLQKLKLELIIRLGGIAIACTGILLAGIPIIMKSF